MSDDAMYVHKQFYHNNFRQIFGLFGCRSVFAEKLMDDMNDRRCREKMKTNNSNDEMPPSSSSLSTS